MLSPASLAPAAQVVDQPDRGHGCDSERHTAWGPSSAECDDPADQRKADAAVVDGERAACGQDVYELPATVCEAGEVPARRAVLQIELDLDERETGPCGVDGHPRLAPEPRREREAGGPRRRRERALTRERLARLAAGQDPDQEARYAFDEAEAASATVGESCHGQVC